MKNSILEKARWLREVALATSKNNGARVAREWLKYAAMFVMLFTIGSGNVWGADATISLDFEGSSGSWPYNSNWTCDASSNATNHTNGGSRSAGMSKNGSQYITCSLELTNIKQVTLWVNRTTKNTAKPTITIQKSTDGGKNWSDITGASQTFAITKNEWAQKTFDFASYKYNGRVRIKYTNSTTAIKLIDDIVITYEEASCDNKVTISKGSETNGTFTLDKTGEQNACDALSVTITPSPAEHFHVASVSATNPATTGTAGEAVDNGDGTWTITYSANSKGASTVNVTFEEDTKHTLTFYNNGAQVEQIQVYDGEKIGASLPSLTSNEACHATSQIFAGWTTENIGSTPVHTVDVDKIVGYWTKPTSDMTIYAIWATIPASATTTFAATDYDTEKAPITKEKDNITLYFDAGSIYKNKTPYTFTITSGNHYFSITASNKVLAKLETTCNDGTYCLYSVSDGTLSPNSSTASQTVTGINTYNVECYPKSDKQIRMQTCAVYCYDNYITSCQACVAPTSVTITGTNKYLGGQTISLTAAPDGGTGTPSYQWQKKISGVWTNLANDGSISGVTSNNLQISSCSYVNSGGYRCIVSTGGGCETKSHADGTDGYGVHVFSIHGKYTTDADYSDTEIIWTSETTGTATISMDAKKTYLFKVWSNNGNYYGHGANTNEDFMFQPTTWDCGVYNNEMRLFTTVAGNYTFTVNIEHGLDGSPYVNVQVGYPSMTHPNSGYVYVQKFNWQPYLHYWYDNSHPLSTWGSDPQLAANQYTSICGTDYWCVPVIDYYCNFIAKDAAGNPSNTTGDQHTNSPHPGQRLYNDGSWKWGEFSTYTITYAGGDGSTGGPMASHTGLCPGSSQKLTANAFSKSGYNFSGWTANVDVKIGGSTVPAGTLITGTPIIENVQSNITLTAQWRDLAQYHVTFSADNGTVAGGASQTVTEGGTLTFPNVTSTTCGTFSGWVEAAYDNTAAPSGATYHAVGDELAADPSMDGKTYYAVYHVAMGAPMKYQTSPACSPVINMTSSFSSFTYVYGSGPSASQSFTVSGANLGANLVVTAPANYEVCKTFGGDYTTSVSYTPSDGTVTDQTVYIRLKAGLNVGAYNYAAASGVSAASTGATTRTAALTGSVTKAAGAIAFTDFNAGDHYEAEWTGSAILVPYNYILTGDGTLTTTKVDGRGGTVDTENKKWSLTNEGTYQLRLTLGNGTNYTGAGPVTADFVIYKADRFYDNLHGNDVIVKRNDTGEDHYTIPSLTDESRQTSGSCSETHYHFMGWVPESALSTLSNDAAYDAVMITGGGTQAASGTNYYAVWAEE